MSNNYKIGDRVVCMDDRNSENLFAGYEYKIVAINQHGNIQVTKGLDGDEPLPHFYKPLRFDVVATSQNTKKNAVKKETKTFDPSKNYKTRDGKEFKFIGMSRDRQYPVVGEWLDKEDGEWYQTTWTLDGKYYERGESDDDLVEVVDEIEIKIGDINVRVFDDKSILFGTQATNPLTNDEIDAFIAALEMFRN
jgi:hypothetical protein